MLWTPAHTRNTIANINVYNIYIRIQLRLLRKIKIFHFRFYDNAIIRTTKRRTIYYYISVFYCRVETTPEKCPSYTKNEQQNTIHIKKQYKPRRYKVIDFENSFLHYYYFVRCIYYTLKTNRLDSRRYIQESSKTTIPCCF